MRKCLKPSTTLKKQGKIRIFGVSTHNDAAGVIKAATNTGKYDMVMA